MPKHLGTMPLETKRLLLRGLKLADAPLAFQNWTSDEEAARFMRWNVHDNLEITEEWMKVCEQTMADVTRYEWGIILKDSGEPIGSIGAFLNDKEPDRYELGYVLGKKYWNQGYTTEALKGAMDFLINQVGVRHFICSHAKDNPASGAVMGHVGFRYQKDGTYQSFDGLRSYESKVYYLDI